VSEWWWESQKEKEKSIETKFIFRFYVYSSSFVVELCEFSLSSQFSRDASSLRFRECYFFVAKNLFIFIFFGLEKNEREIEIENKKKV
jgi:hypothetical protein